MVGRQLTPMEIRALQGRQANIASLVRTFKDSIESDKLRAPQSLREEAFTGLWHFSKIREQVPAAVRDLAEFMDRENPRQDDPEFTLRIMRISIALYLLDKMGELSNVVKANRGLKMTALFSTARAGVERLLDERYFSKSHKEILNGYLDAEPALASISAVCRVPLPELYDVLKAYKGKVADMMPEGPIEPCPAGIPAIQ